MAARTKTIEFTPVRARRGRLIHAYAFGPSREVACGRRVARMVVAALATSPVGARVTCRACKLAIVWDAGKHG